MNLENYVNLMTWVEELNSTIEDVLLERLREAIISWTTTFNSDVYHGNKSRRNVQEDKAKLITIDTTLHELTIRNQVIFLEPPLEHARTICLSSLHNWLGLSCLLRSHAS
jgi:dynein heavy chain 1, cytosolic